MKPDFSALSDCTGAILAGGKSRRFGSDKALAAVDGVPVLARMRDRLAPAVRRVVIIADARAEYAFLGLPLIADIYRGAGPLGGIHAALAASFSEWTLVTPCDLPFFSPNMGGVLAAYRGACDAVCFTIGGKPEPLPALFHRGAQGKIAAYIAHGDYALHEFLRTCILKTVPVESCGGMVSIKMFFNCNTQRDYQTIMKR